MKLLKWMLLTGLMILLLSCSSGEKDHAKKTIIDYNSLKKVQKNCASLKGLGNIKKAVKLETITDSLLGSIDRIIVDSESGNLLIGDFGNSQRVLRFSKEGKFLRGYQKIGAGPGEAASILDYVLTQTGDVILLTNTKLIKFSKNGELLNEVRINFFSRFIEIIDDLIYIHVLQYRNTPKVKSAILIFNSFLVEVGGIGTYDNRLGKTLFIPWNTLAKKGNLLFFIDIYDLILNIYDTKTKTLSRLTVPNRNSQLDGVWEKNRLSQVDEEEIRTQLHRFNDIFGLKNHLLLFENNRKSLLFNCWLLNLEKNEVHIFNQKCLTGDFQQKVQKDLFFYQIIGAYDNGIVGSFSDPEEFNRFKADYPLLKDIEFNPDDNPVIAFFEFNDELSR